MAVVVDPAHPAMRAIWTRQLIEAARELNDEQRAGFEGRVGATKLVYLEQTDLLSWVPIEDHLTVLDALLDVLGPAEFVALGRRAAVQTMRSPFLRKVAVVGVKLFGRAALLRVLPRGWRLSLRNCGQLRVVRDAKAGITDLIISDLPPQLWNSASYRLVLAATFAGTLDLGGYVGRVQVDDGEYADEELRFRVSLIIEPENDPSESHCGGVTRSQS